MIYTYIYILLFIMNCGISQAQQQDTIPFYYTPELTNIVYGSYIDDKFQYYNSYESLGYPYGLYYNVIPLASYPSPAVYGYEPSITYGSYSQPAYSQPGTYGYIPYICYYAYEITEQSLSNSNLTFVST